MIHLGVDPAGGDSVDVDGWRKFDSEIVGEIDEGSLGSIISSAGWEERVDTVCAGNIDNLATSLFAHKATDGSASEKWTDEIGGEGEFPIFDGVIGKFFVDGDAGIIDEDVNFFKSGEGLLDEKINIGFLANVGRDDEGLDVIFGFERRFERSGLVERVKVVDDQIVSASGKFGGNGASDAATTAGNKSYWGGGIHGDIIT